MRKTPEEAAKELEAARLKIYMVMMQHVGPDKKIGMGELYQEVFGAKWAHRINDTKKIRSLVTEMRQQGQPIMSDTSSSAGGYWIAASASEVNDWADRTKSRALKILSRISKVKKISLPEFLGQLQLELEAPIETK
jgi:hypothetical protein